MSGSAVEHVEAQDLEARKHLNRVLVTADQMASATLVLRSDLRNKVQDVRAIALTLDQHGLPITIQNVNACFVVNGAVEFMTRLWTGLAMARGHHRVWVCDADPAKCDCSSPSSATEGRAHIQRGDDGMTYTATFSWEQAKTAGLTDSATYRKFPQDMLGWRALSRAVKRYAPDIVIGVGAAISDTATVARPRPPAFDSTPATEDEDVVDGEIVEQGEDIVMPAQMSAGGAGVSPVAAAASAPIPDGALAPKTASPSGPVAGDGPEEVGDNAGATIVEASSAPSPPGPVDWRALAAQHGVTPGKLLIQARAFAKARALPEPAALDEITDEQLAADVVDWMGPVPA